jgi:hypothetical protein
MPMSPSAPSSQSVPARQPRIDVRGWPPLLAEIAALASPEAALRLVERFGGVACYFPKRPRPGHVLVDAIGLEAAKILAERFGGTSPEIPVLATRHRLKQAIVEAEGGTAEIARDLGCSARYVRMIRNSGRPPA